MVLENTGNNNIDVRSIIVGDWESKGRPKTITQNNDKLNLTKKNIRFVNIFANIQGYASVKTLGTFRHRGFVICKSLFRF